MTNNKKMKARHLFVTLFLPSVFMACTADDWTTEQQGNPALQGRKVVGDITFVAPDADTRVVFDPETKGLKWTSADRLGAALMDETSDGEIYNLVNKVYTNYLYTYDNGVFTNGNATFVEGNYFIYAQYRDQARTGGLAYSINPDQETGTDKMQAWYDNQMFLDHVFIEQGADNQVVIDPLGVFPRVRFDLKYEGSNYNDLVINKIVVKDAVGKFNVVGALTPANTTAAYNPLGMYEITAINSSNVRKDYYKKTSATIADAFNLYKKAKADLGVKYTVNGVEAKDVKFVSPILADYFNGTRDGEDATAMTLNFSEPANFAQGIMVLPLSETHTNSNLTFEIYTNKGMVTIAGRASDMSNAFTMSDVADYPTSSTITGTSLKDKAQKAINFTGLNATFVAGLVSDVQQNTTINFKDDAILVPSEITVSDTEELVYYLQNWYANKKGNVVGGDGNMVTVTAAPKANSTVDINATVLEFIKNDAANPVVKFVGDIVIPEGADATTINYIVKGSDNLNVINKATQNWTATAEFTTLTNEGTLTIGTDVANETATYKVPTVTNNGTMTVNKALVAGHTINNNNVLTLNANVETVSNGKANSSATSNDANHNATLTINKGIVNSLSNNALLNIPASKTAEVKALYNRYKITIEGYLNVSTTASDSKNATYGTTGDAEITVSEGATWAIGANFDNKGIVTNNGTITVNSGIFTNNGTVNTIGQIACASTGKFNNANDMNVSGANSITLISDNQNAEIIVSEEVSSIFVAGNQGKITYIIESQDGMNTIPAIANSLRITSGLINLQNFSNASRMSAGGKEIVYVEFMPSTATININCNTTTANEFENVEFTAGTTAKTFNLFGNLTADTSLNIGANASVVINNNLTFAAASETGFTNDGQMLIIGKLNFGFSKPSDTSFLGTYLFAGGDDTTNITWQ